MYHSITFGDKNTWDDWHLIPSTRPSFSSPELKENTVDIPGANGHLDLSDALTGYPLFENRTGSWEFYIIHDYWIDWVDTVHTVMSYLHGQRMTCFLEDDPAYIYDGRFKVSEFSSEDSYSTLTIEYDVYPYKKELLWSTEPWLWDPFDFEYGVIREYKDIIISGNYSLTIENAGDEPMALQIWWEPTTTDLNLTIKFNGANGAVTHTATGEQNVGHKFIYPDIIITPEYNKLTFTGTGSITVSYRGGYF